MAWFYKTACAYLKCNIFTSASPRSLSDKYSHQKGPRNGARIKPDTQQITPCQQNVVSRSETDPTHGATESPLLPLRKSDLGQICAAKKGKGMKNADIPWGSSLIGAAREQQKERLRKPNPWLSSGRIKLNGAEIWTRKGTIYGHIFSIPRGNTDKHTHPFDSWVWHTEG